jgi:von Willebrand factor A domain-containing protein 5
MNSNMGWTEIEIPLRKILKSKVIPGYPKQIFLLTDGEVNNTEAVIDIVRKNIKYSRVHAIGLGDGASAALIRGCA